MCTRLAVFLELGQNQVQRVSKSRLSSDSELVFNDVFINWLQQKGDKATRQILHDALLSLQRQDLADQFKNILTGEQTDPGEDNTV